MCRNSTALFCVPKTKSNGQSLLFLPRGSQGWAMHISLRGWAGDDALTTREQVTEVIAAGTIN